MRAVEAVTSLKLTRFFLHTEPNWSQEIHVVQNRIGHDFTSKQSYECAIYHCNCSTLFCVRRVKGRCGKSLNRRERVRVRTLLVFAGSDVLLQERIITVSRPSKDITSHCENIELDQLQRIWCML